MRLNNDLRRDIQKRLLAHQFDKRKQELSNRSSELFNAVIDHLLGEFKAQVEAMPEGFFGVDDDVCVFPNASRHWGEKIYLTGHHTRRMPHNMPNPTIPELGELGKRILAYVQDSEAYDEDRDEIATDIWRVLIKARSTEALLKAWPEVEPFLNLPDAPIATPLAKIVDFAALNKHLGLPVSEP